MMYWYTKLVHPRLSPKFKPFFHRIIQFPLEYFMVSLSSHEIQTYATIIKFNIRFLFFLSLKKNIRTFFYSTKEPAATKRIKMRLGEMK